MEKIVEENPEKLMFDFEQKFSNKDLITLEDLEYLKNQGITTEMFLTFLEKRHGYLFHGSRSDIAIGEEIVSSNKAIFATNEPAIAILKAIFLNNARNLGYPLNLDDDKSNMKLNISGPKEDTIGDLGFVYIIDGREEFEVDKNSNWQFVINSPEGKGINFIKKIQIERRDFKYPVEIEN